MPVLDAMEFRRCDGRKSKRFGGGSQSLGKERMRMWDGTMAIEEYKGNGDVLGIVWTIGGGCCLIGSEAFV